MILADTSVWIDFFRDKPETRLLRALLHEENVAIHSWIIGELMMGDLSPCRTKILEQVNLLSSVPVYPVDELSHFVEKEKLYGHGLSLVDVQLLYASIVTDSPLWTLDKALKRMATKYGVGFGGLVT